MNVPKKNVVVNNWILCPSKSHPGKFYYFNVGNGEAVWSINENEKTIMQKDDRLNVENASHKYHSYPEPNTPPNDSPEITATSSWPSTSISNPWPRYIRHYSQSRSFSQQSPNPWSLGKHIQNEKTTPQYTMFGQPAHFVTNLGPFMPSIPNVGMPMPSFVWTPMQLPIPGWPPLAPEVKPTTDRDTQTPQMLRDLFVPTNGVPLSQKFVSYETPYLYFNKENTIKKRPQHFLTSTPNKNLNPEKELFQNQASTSKSLPDQVFNMETQSATNNFAGKPTLNTSNKSEFDIKKSDISNIDKISETSDTSTLSSSQKIMFPKPRWQTDESGIRDNRNLNKSDLRFHLIAKRVKSQEEKANNDPVAIKRPKIEVQQQPSNKKRVTFALDKNSDTSISTDDEPNKCNQNTTTTGKRSPFFYKTPISPKPTALNYYSLLDNKPPVIDGSRNSILTQNKRTHNMSKTNMTSHNIQTINFRNSMPIHNMTPIHHIGNNDGKTYPINLEAVKEGAKSIVKTKPISKTQTVNTDINNSTEDNTQNSPIISFKESSKSMPQLNIPIKISTAMKGISKSMPTKEIAVGSLKAPNSHAIRKVWHVVADIDVLLEELLMIDKLLESGYIQRIIYKQKQLLTDEKCRLIIPHFVRTRLESMCIGDCRGQQRVLVARQLSRRMLTPHKQYIVEPPPVDENITFDPTAAILDSCLQILKKQHAVVLITNDPHLKMKATSLNIRCINPTEIKNGAIFRPKLFSELKKIKVMVNNDGTDEHNDNIPVDMYKKQLFVKEKQTDRNLDILMNITKPKMTYHEAKSDQNEISNRVKQLNLIDIHTNRDPEIQSSFFTESIKKVNEADENPQEHTETKILNTYNFRNLKTRNQDTSNFKTSIPNSKSTQNLYLKSPKFDEKENHQNIKNTIVCTQKRTNSLLDISDTEHYPISNEGQDTKSLQNEITDKVTTHARESVGKIMCALNQKTLIKNIENQKFSEKNLQSLNKFKIPNIVPSKKGTKYTSTLNERPLTTDKIRSNFKHSEQSWLEANLKKFRIKNKMMQEKLKTKMDEWTCTYTQIMEYLLNDILQNNLEYVKQTDLTSINLRDALTCIKMMYDDAKLKDIIEVLVALTDECACSKGKLKLDTAPKDFMKIIGCGVLLVQTLKNILPDFKVLDDYESYLDILISNIESTAVDLDPEQLQPTVVCRSDLDKINEDTRFNFSKKPSMIIGYLKKHYKEWSSYDENQDREPDESYTSPEAEYKIVRLFGKNINKLKIDNNKSISYVQTTRDNHSILEKEAGTKLVRLIDNSHSSKEVVDANPSQNKDTGLLLRRITSFPHSIFSEESDSEINKTNIEQNVVGEKQTNKHLTRDAEPKSVEFIENDNQFCEDEYSEYGHTFLSENKKSEPKVIRNIKMIDVYEKKMKNKEPLEDSDYSERPDNNIKTLANRRTHGYNFENSENSNKTQKLQITASKKDFSRNFFCYNENSNRNPVLLTSKINNYNTINNSKDLDITEESDINKNIVKTGLLNKRKKNWTESFEEKTHKYEKTNVITKNNMNNYENDVKNASQDDSTNDSGFENETFQARSLIKVFFNELSATFKALYKFITDFLKEIGEELLCEERKKILHLKANKIMQEVCGVIKQLKSIVERESYEDTPLKTILLRSGGEDIKDPKITQYSYTVKKCLEQAEILQTALRIILNITNEDINTILQTPGF